MPANIAARLKYIEEYFLLEFCCYRWIHLSPEECDELEQKDEQFSRKNGYKFKKNNTYHFEFHVDDHDSFIDTTFDRYPLEEPSV